MCRVSQKGLTTGSVAVSSAHRRLSNVSRIVRTNKAPRQDKDFKSEAYIQRYVYHCCRELCPLLEGERGDAPSAHVSSSKSISTMHWMTHEPKRHILFQSFHRFSSKQCCVWGFSVSAPSLIFQLSRPPRLFS